MSITYQQKDHNLTREEATLRADTINAGVEYQVFVDLKKGKEYSCSVSIQFSASKCGDSFLDFGGKSLNSVNFNGHEWTKNDEGLFPQLSSGKLELKGIKEGQNCLFITLDNEYYSDGNGLHSFTDIDGCQYTYTQCEPHMS